MLRISTLIFLLFSYAAFSQTIVPVTDADIQPGQTVNWTADNIYVMDGFVFVDEGAVLNIEPGTVIKGKPGEGADATALIVARGGIIQALGTADNPIIFTMEADDTNDPFDIAANTRGQWGGLIILGRAEINTTTGVGQIEGLPTTEPRGAYGGTDNADSSGVVRYVSIRYGGSNIGQNNEINGLTMGAVGNRTVIEYIEVFNNKDDGFEWFGGTVNTRYLVAAFCGDDAFDYDEGFRGYGQFWFSLMADDIGNRAGEHDGGTDPEGGMPFAIPVVHNATYIGSGATSFNAENDVVFKIRDNAGAKYYNSVFTDFFEKAVDIEDVSGDSLTDSRARFENGDIVFNNNIWYGFGAGDNLDSMITKDWARPYFADAANNNWIEDPQYNSVDRGHDNLMSPLPESTSPVFTRPKAAAPSNWFKNVNHLGAFGTNNWTRGWTFLSEVVTGIDETPINTSIPTDYEISQNYPNPFNPSTSIDYSVRSNALVEITVYNIQGQKVATLVNGYRPAGAYTVKWNAENLPSGVYLYHFQAGNTVQTKKMMLIK